MAKNRERRYRSALLLAEDLRRYLDHRPLAVRPPGPAIRLVRWTQRRPRLAVAVGGLILSLTAGLVITAILLGNVRDRSRELEVRTAQIARLADVMRLDLLAKLEPLLLPATPSRVEGANGMDGWITMAEELLDRQSVDEAFLRDLRQRARPRTEAERSADRRANALAMPETVAAVQRLEAQRRELGSSRRPDRAQRIAALDEEIAALEALLSAQRQWRFEDDMDTWRHDLMSEVVARLLELPDKLRRMRSRREIALSLRRRSIEDHSAAWEGVRSRVAASAIYGGLRIEPQLGLIPLGPDPDSELEEFAHLPSGEPPPRDPRTGRFRITPESSLVFVLVPPTGITLDAGAGTDRGREVAVDAFLLSKYEMTRGQWLRLRGDDHFGDPANSFDPALTHPAALVSWWEAAGAMSAMDCSLPDAASMIAAGPIPRRPATAGPRAGVPVDAGPPNPRGFHGLGGGVWEWNRSEGDPVVEPFRMVWAPTPPLPASWVVRCRGGATSAADSPVRSVPPATRGPDIGIRPLRSLDG
jgi:hypothetical protein